MTGKEGFFSYFEILLPTTNTYLQLTKHIHKTLSYCYHVAVHNNVFILNQCTYYRGLSNSFAGIGTGANCLTGIKNGLVKYFFILNWS
jgi:hypothetical protein